MDAQNETTPMPGGPQERQGGADGQEENFTIDKAAFGAFVAARRKQQGLTQKQLAQRLFVSDKAVSKWERGLSMPDIQLLRPLARTLDVTVAELLACRPLPPFPVPPADAEALAQRAIELSAPAQSLPRAHRPGLLAGALAAAAAELFFLRLLGMPGQDIAAGPLLPAAMAAGFLAYFCLGVRTQLPYYYDLDRISFYADGPFHMNMAGLAFNNRNWPFIVAAVQRALAAALVAAPVLGGAAHLAGLPPQAGMAAGGLVLLLVLFIAIYRAGRSRN